MLNSFAIVKRKRNRMLNILIDVDSGRSLGVKLTFLFSRPSSL